MTMTRLDIIDGLTAGILALTWIASMLVLWSKVLEARHQLSKVSQGYALHNNQKLAELTEACYTQQAEIRSLKAELSNKHAHQLDSLRQMAKEAMLRKAGD